jgi:hypothetical protein
MNWIEWVFASLLGAWLLLSVANQFHDYAAIAAIRRYDPLHLLPVWTFFAPNPGRSDYHVVSRDRLATGERTEWRDALPIPRHTLQASIWNPNKRLVKVVTDAVSSTVEAYASAQDEEQSREALQRALLIYGPYLLLVHIVGNSTQHAKGSVAFQFLIVERFAFGADGATRPLFKSPFHRFS